MLRVFTNHDRSEFRIGWHEDDFDISSAENLQNYLNIGEIELVSIQERFGAITDYFNFRTDEECSREAYAEHFIDYDSDVSYIIPFPTFDSLEKASVCLKELNLLYEYRMGGERMEYEYQCAKCKHKTWNEYLKEWECRFADIPNREECINDYEEEKR